MKVPSFLRTGAVLLTTLVFVAGCDVKVQSKRAVETVSYTPEEQSASEQSLRAFIAAVDAGTDTWGHLAVPTKLTTSETAWSGFLATLNTACGKNLSRGNVRIGCTEKLPNAPAGRYFIYDIDSKFERADLTERVVLIQENGAWKIAGYFRTKSISLGGDKKS